MSSVALVLAPSDLADRASIVLTLVLTVVAFKLSIAKGLPQAAYLTVLDKYIVCVLLALTVAMCGSVYVYSLGEYQHVHAHSWTFAAIYIIAWALLHPLLWWHSNLLRRRRNEVQTIV